MSPCSQCCQPGINFHFFVNGTTGLYWIVVSAKYDNHYGKHKKSWLPTVNPVYQVIRWQCWFCRDLNICQMRFKKIQSYLWLKKNYNIITMLLNILLLKYAKNEKKYIFQNHLHIVLYFNIFVIGIFNIVFFYILVYFIF